MNSIQLTQLMQTIADGWNEGNARKSADGFSEDAVYVEPPGKQIYRRRAERYDFSAGTTVLKSPHS